jgi:hypothetical protein
VYCGNTVIADWGNEVSGVKAVLRTDELLKQARVEVQLRNYGTAYDYYSQVSERDPQNVEALLGRAGTVNYSSRSQREQARVLSTGATSTPMFLRLMNQERDRISEECLTHFERACELLKNKDRANATGVVGTWAERIATLARGAGLFDRSGLPLSDAVERDYERRQTQHRLGRFIQCLHRAWETEPSLPLVKELTACCAQYISLSSDRSTCQWIVSLQHELRMHQESGHLKSN